MPVTRVEAKTQFTLVDQGRRECQIADRDLVRTGQPVRYRALKPAIKHQRPVFAQVTNDSSIQDNAGRPTRSCRVRLCRLVHCTLRSHRYDIGLPTQFDETPLPEASVEQKSFQADILSDEHHPNDYQLLRGGIDGFPSLPLEEQHRDVYVELFHHFFTQQYDRIMRVVTPHAIGTFQPRQFALEKKRAFARALSAPIFCLHVCASSHHQIVFRRDGLYPNDITALIQMALTALLRDLLDDAELASSNTNDVALVILTLVMFETSRDDYSALPYHRKAMYYLTRRQGGIHNMEKWIPFVMLLDRLISIFTALPPLLCQYPDRALRRPSKYPHIYGSHLESHRHNCAPSEQIIYDFCLDTCRAIEVMEHQGPLFDPMQTPKAEYQDLHYLYYLKETLAGQFAHLNADLSQGLTLEVKQLRCVLLATKIVDLTVLHNNYMVSIPTYCANTAQGIIDQHRNLPSFFNPSPKLLWILFVLASMRIHWKGYGWAVEQIRRLLALKYASSNPSKWPTDWRITEHDHVRTFVWSDTYFGPGFIRCCTDVTMPQTSTLSEPHDYLDAMSLDHSIDTTFQNQLN